MRRVVIESPYAGETKQAIERNIRYARACMLDCFNRNEAPFASHLLYTQDGILDDNNEDERNAGMLAGFIWGDCAELTVVYIDYGISDGMRAGIKRAKAMGRGIEYRSLIGRLDPKIWMDTVVHIVAVIENGEQNYQVS